MIDEDSLKRTLFVNQHGQPGGTAGREHPAGRHTGGPRRDGHQNTVTRRGDRQKHCAALLPQSCDLHLRRTGLALGELIACFY